MAGFYRKEKLGEENRLSATSLKFLADTVNQIKTI